MDAILHLIAYDIASDRRLRRVARICEDFGVRVERSVFECDLTDVQFAAFWKRLSLEVSDDADKVVDYPIGLLDKGKIKTMGHVGRNEPSLTYVL